MRMRALVAAHGKEIILKGLALIMVWGLGAFAWGSLNAWHKYKNKQRLEIAILAAQPMVTDWLQAPLQPLEQIAATPEFIATLQTPLGLASPAAERALAQVTSPQADPDLFLYDAASGQTLLPLGFTPPAAEVFTALTKLPSTTAKLITAGSRTGMVYYALRLPTQPQQQVYAIRARSIRQLATAFQQTPVADEVTLQLQLPHTEGTATWHQNEPLRLQIGSAAPALVEGLASPVFPNVQLQSAFTKLPAGVAWGLRAIIILWVLCGTLLVLWPYTAGVRAVLWQRVAPWLGPLAAKLQQLWEMLANLKLPKLNLGKLAEIFKAWQTNANNPATSWSSSTATQANPVAELIAGPGTYSAADFGSGNMAVTTPASNRPKLKPLGQTAVQSIEKDLASGKPLNESEEVSPDVLKARVQRCIRQGLLELLYQPMYRNDNGAVEGNEILARLADASGPIAPGQFIPVLAALNQISSLDALVFEHTMSAHFAAGKSPPVMLSLNISGTSLEDLGYLRDVAQRGPSVLKHLMFEVRSNEVVRDPNALQLLKALQRQGGRVAVDYFGGGNAMIEASKALGIDYIKIDVMRFSSSSALKNEFNEVCALASKIGLAVVVEKIEDKEMESLARRAGATLLQGYGMGKPTPTMMTLPLSAKM